MSKTKKNNAPSPMPTFEIRRTDIEVMELRLWNWKPEVRFVFMSDVHLDSVWFDEQSFKEDVQRARDLGAFVIVAGDVFDAMQGKYDPRRTYDEILPELQGADYYDRLVDRAEELFAPIAENLILLGYGNHETAVREKAGTDLLQRLADRLRTKHGSRVEVGGYDGYVVASFMEDNRKRVLAKSTIYYHHGATGGAPVSFGAIEQHRQRDIMANIVLNGHNHRDLIKPDVMEFVTTRGTRIMQQRYFLRTPGYKAAWIGNKFGFEKVKRHGGRVVGGMLATVRYTAVPRVKANRMRIEVTDWSRPPARPYGARRAARMAEARLG